MHGARTVTLTVTLTSHLSPLSSHPHPRAGECWLRDLLTWTAIAHHAAATASEPNRCRVGLGVPFSRSAASGGQISAQLALQKIEDAIHAFPAPLKVWRHGSLTLG